MKEDASQREPTIADVLSRLDAIDGRLDSIENMQNYSAMALLDLLVAMKDDEKVRSQMLGRVSEIKTTYEEKVSEILRRRAS